MNTKFWSSYLWPLKTAFTVSSLIRMGRFDVYFIYYSSTSQIIICNTKLDPMRYYLRLHFVSQIMRGVNVTRSLKYNGFRFEFLYEKQNFRDKKWKYWFCQIF